MTFTVAIDQPPQTPTASGFIWLIGGSLGPCLLSARRRFGRAILAVAATVLPGAVTIGLEARGRGSQFITPAGTSAVTVERMDRPIHRGIDYNQQTVPVEQSRESFTAGAIST